MVRFLALGLYSNFEGSWHAKKYKSVRGCPPTIGTGTGNVVCTDMLYYGVWVCLLARGPINGGGLISGYRPMGLYARNYGKSCHDDLMQCLTDSSSTKAEHHEHFNSLLQGASLHTRLRKSCKVLCENEESCESWDFFQNNQKW